MRACPELFSREQKDERQMECQQIVTRLRVVGEAVKPFQYGLTNEGVPLSQPAGEVVEVKATGVWGEYNWPMSLHITVPPGCGAIPVFGDDIKVTVERALD